MAREGAGWLDGSGAGIAGRGTGMVQWAQRHSWRAGWG